MVMPCVNRRNSAAKSATAAGNTVCTVREASDARHRIRRVVALPRKYLVRRSRIGKLIRSRMLLLSLETSFLHENSNAGFLYPGTLNHVYAVIPEIYQSPKGSQAPLCRQSPMPRIC